MAYFEKGISVFAQGYYLAEMDGEVAGNTEGFPIQRKIPIAMLSELEDQIDLFEPQGQFYYIHIIQVLPSFRRRGIGNALLKKQIEVARRKEILEVCGIGIAEQIPYWVVHQ